MFTKGEENGKIKVLFVEIATVSTVGERTEVLFFNVLTVSRSVKVFLFGWFYILKFLLPCMSLLHSRGRETLNKNRACVCLK